MISFPNSKINIGLHVINKREDGFHNIESVFYPISFCDGLEIVANKHANTGGWSGRFYHWQSVNQ